MLVALDYETNGLEYYRKDFQVLSCAFTWKNGDKYESLYCEGQEEVGKKLRSLIAKGHELIVFNYQFEYGVSKYVYGIDLNIHADVQRLVQYYGPAGFKGDTLSFGLSKSVERILNIPDYKKKYHEWLRANVKIPKNQNPGRFIGSLPPDLLAEYNCADTEYTFRLYDFLTSHFKPTKYDWTVDHTTYCQMVHLFCHSKARGVLIDIDMLRSYLGQVTQEVDNIDSAFLKQNEEDIGNLIKKRYQRRLQAYKSERGRASMTWEKFLLTPQALFNPASSDQLAELIVKEKGCKVAVWTHYDTEGNPTSAAKPSFKGKTLEHWGKEVELLRKRGKRKKVKEFCQSLLVKASESQSGDIWHPDLKAVGTVTGRYAGGGGLNIQGVPRRDEGFMKSIYAREGHVFVSSDISSGEPTITTYYTKDKHYSLLNGRDPFVPYWNKEGVLVISDIYLCTLSMFSKGREVLLEAWNREWPEGSFVEQWAKDKEEIKDYLSSPRSGFKAVALGLSYGMRPNKLRQTIRMFGWECTKEDAQKLYTKYWEFYSGLSKFIKITGAMAKRQGYLINEFGFRSSPEPNKAFNWFIQSSVNPIINIFTLKVKELSPWAEYVVIIHDEVVFEIPEDKIEEFKNNCGVAEAHLNKILNWEGVTMRMGFKPGKTLYDAK